MTPVSPVSHRGGCHFAQHCSFADSLLRTDFCSDKFRQGWAEDKDNIGTVDDLLDAYIALYNDSISKVPADMHTGVHLCRGNVRLSFWPLTEAEYLTALLVHWRPPLR